MSLGGSLEDISLLDILQIVNVSRRTGALRLSIPDLGKTLIFFKSGGVTDIVGGYDESVFIEFFLKQGLLDESELEQARDACDGSAKAILDFLLEQNILNRRLVEQARGLEISRRLKTLTDEVKGEFDFFLTESGDKLEVGAPDQFFPLSNPSSPQNLLTQTVTADNFSEWVPPSDTSPKPIPEEEKAEPASHFDDDSEQEVPTIEIIEEIKIQPTEEETQESEPELEPEPELQPAPELAEHKASPRVVPAKNQITILLASDQSIFTTMLKRKLLEHFADVIEIGSKSEYLATCKELLDNHTPFLSLVDLLMPSESGEGYLGGLEIIQSSNTSYPNVKIMMMSDLKDEKILKLAKTHGVVEILQKPGLVNLRVDEFEKSIKGFADDLCQKVDILFPPQDEEITTFLRDLGSEGRPGRITNQLTLLKGLMGELASPKESSEISLLVLRLAAEYFERAILFLVKKEAFAGLGGFGETGSSRMMMQRVRNLSIPSDEDTIFSDAVASRSISVREKGDFTDADLAFTGALGPYIPPVSVAIPMVSRKRVIALLYGDNAVSGEPLIDMTGLEIFMTQAGMAMEKALLEMQLLHLQRHLPKQD